MIINKMEHINGIYANGKLINSNYIYECDTITLGVTHLERKEINYIITNYWCYLKINGTEIVFKDCLYFVDEIMDMINLKIVLKKK